MDIHISPDASSLGSAAARAGGAILRNALKRQDRVSIIVATGASQFAMLSALVGEPDIDWKRVRIFHLDEYVGLPVTHPASFRKYLQERLIEPLGEVAEFISVDGDAPDIEKEIERLNALMKETTVELGFVGIGENAHLAFNDPPADFETQAPFIVVELDEDCRRQQLGEGWFPDLASVPRTALSMSIRQIMKTKTLIVSVPDRRKANAVRAVMEDALSPAVPASILRTHPDCTVFLDEESASMLSEKRPVTV